MVRLLTPLSTAVFLCGLLAAGCAEGGTGDGSGGGTDAGTRPHDGGPRVDAYVPRFDSGTLPRLDGGRDSGIRRDAGRTLDAGIARDSGFFPTPDAGMMGFFCTTTADCSSMPGTCCLRFPPDSPMGFCVAGMEFAGMCLPSGG